MSKFKSNLIKFFTLLFVACSALAISLIPQTKMAEAQELSAFSVEQNASIRNSEDGIVGLQFTSTVNEAWLSENSAEKYSFGTVIYPTKNTVLVL